MINTQDLTKNIIPKIINEEVVSIGYNTNSNNKEEPKHPIVQVIDIKPVSGVKGKYTVHLSDGTKWGLGSITPRNPIGKHLKHSAIIKMITDHNEQYGKREVIVVQGAQRARITQ